MRNRLIFETSPYLLQHAENPVDWFPWGTAAFDKAKAEDKPVFLSIGYSTCHWCHVMAHESFENPEIAGILNNYFVCIKVDKEQRPDIDSIYMAVCQAFTGSGGWPTSIFMTPEQKPFFAGTYFPKTTRNGMIGFKELLLTVQARWKNHRSDVMHTADHVTAALRQQQSQKPAQADENLLETALAQYKQSFDRAFGGFGAAPKFPSPHNLLFLMQQSQKNGDPEALEMAETTLEQMYKGGMFDHIGYGFCRYSTDQFFLVPHFEKMLYDNALLMLAYCKAFEITQKARYREIAEKIGFYILTEMTSPEGGFYSAQDADSDGVEGKYYVFTPQEITALLGEQDAAAFNKAYAITEAGNFEGKSIPNLLQSNADVSVFEPFLPAIRAYRRRRCSLHTDDKILTAWNALMIAALCALYRVSQSETYLAAAKKAQEFVETNLCLDGTLHVSYRNGKQGDKGFLDDYAFYCYALLCLYDATLDPAFLHRAEQLAAKAVADFFDAENGGFYLYGKENEPLLFRPKECYDGAMPSGNSVMAYNLVRLNALQSTKSLNHALQKQLDFLSGQAANYPAGHAMALLAISDACNPPTMITVVLKHRADIANLPFLAPSESLISVLDTPTAAHALLHDQTTYYVCRNHSCQPPTNTLQF